MQERKMMDLFRLKFKGLENAGLKIERPKLRDFLKTLLNPSWSLSLHSWKRRSIWMGTC